MSKTQQLLEWCKARCEEHGVVVKDWTYSWKDGMAWLAIIAHFHPEKINLEEVKARKLTNVAACELAITTAESLGIPRLLDAEDMDMPQPEPLSVITYTSCFYNLFAKGTNPGGGLGSIKEESGARPRAENTTASPPVDDNEPAWKKRLREKKAQSPTMGTVASPVPVPVPVPVKQTPQQSPQPIAVQRAVVGTPVGTTASVAAANKNKCKVCGKIVFALEQISADGEVFHKSCFRCETCKQVLRPGNYGTIDGAFYCTPHHAQKTKEKGSTKATPATQQQPVIHASAAVVEANKPTPIGQTAKRVSASSGVTASGRKSPRSPLTSPRSQAPSTAATVSAAATPSGRKSPRVASPLKSPRGASPLKSPRKSEAGGSEPTPLAQTAASKRTSATRLKSPREQPKATPSAVVRPPTATSKATAEPQPPQQHAEAPAATKAESPRKRPPTASTRKSVSPTGKESASAQPPPLPASIGESPKPKAATAKATAAGTAESKRASQAGAKKTYSTKELVEMVKKYRAKVKELTEELAVAKRDLADERILREAAEKELATLRKLKV